MTNEEILEGNKLIAYFDSSNKDYPDSNSFYLPQFSYDDGEPWVYEKDLRYHRDWNWLMPVIVKIQNLGYICIMYGNYSNILDVESFKGNFSKEEFDCDCYSSSAETLISAVYWCVIKFIKWYNLKKIMKTINLEEILLSCTNFDTHENGLKYECISAMREAIKQALALAAENAEIASGFESTEDYSGHINYYVDKETILGTINQIK